MKYKERYIYICNLSKNFFETVTKENPRTYQRKSKYGSKPVLIKLLMLFNYWSNQMEKLFATVKIFLHTGLRLQYMCKFMTTFS